MLHLTFFVKSFLEFSLTLAFLCIASVHIGMQRDIGHARRVWERVQRARKAGICDDGFGVHHEESGRFAQGSWNGKRNGGAESKERAKEK